jgi:hypothetical protein
MTSPLLSVPRRDGEVKKSLLALLSIYRKCARKRGEEFAVRVKP